MDHHVGLESSGSRTGGLLFERKTERLPSPAEGAGLLNQKSVKTSLAGSNPVLSARMMKEYWLSCRKFTAWIRVDDGVIVDSASIVRKFKGQPLENLKKWSSKFGGFRMEELCQQ